MQALLGSVLEVLFPPSCSACGRSSASPVCSVCEGSLPLLRGPICARCGKPTAVRVSSCRDCAGLDGGLAAVRSAGLHTGGLREIIHSFKYGRRPDLASFLGNLAVKAASGHLYRPDMITFIPLWPAQERERGYNQSRLLALEIGRRMGIPVAPLLSKKRKTAPQNSLPLKSRRRNLRDAFAVSRRADISGSSILLVDDVFTTGSTLSEAAKSLRRSGAGRVDGLTVARAPKELF